MSAELDYQKLYLDMKNRVLNAARDDFMSFVHYMNPNFCESKHHRLIADHLEAVDRGEIKRLMVFMPPRSGKSFMISQYFPAWFLGRHPTRQVLSVSYNIDLAKDWGHFVKGTVGSEEFQEVFPECKLDPAARAAAAWNTQQGGKYRAGGITGGIAGKGASLGLIDDPLNEQDAWSPAAREHVLRWYPGGFRSRLMPDAPVILIMTRWHEEDLAGYLLNNSKESWEVLSIPAILDEEAALKVGFPPGTTYWPPHPNPPANAELTGWSTEYLELTREELPPYQWEALYQQNPSIEGGNIIKRDYWQDWNFDKPPHCDYIFLSLDTAFSVKDSADYSVIQTWGVFEDDESEQKNMILLGAEKGRWEYPVLKQKVLDAYEYHEPDMILIEKKASGQSLLQDLRISGLPVMEFSPDKDKQSRAHAAVPMFHNNRVYAPVDEDWARDVINQCAAFPKGQHDDHVDATTQAIHWVRQGFLVTGLKEDPSFEREKQWRSKKRRRFY